MSSDDSEKPNRIEELKNKLFTKDYRVKSGHTDHFSTYHSKEEVPADWGDGGRPHGTRVPIMRKSAFRKFFIFSIVLLVLAVGYAAYMLFAGRNTVSNDNIDISVVGNTFTAGGEELPLVIGVTNRNSSPLELVDLVVEYPKGSPDDTTAGTERFRDSLGSIPPGEVRNESMKVVLYGEEGSVRQIKISVEYRVEGSNAIFVKEKDFNVSISSSPVNLSLDAPDSVSPNQEVTLNVSETLNSTKPAAGMLLKLDYPVGFQFESATPAPSFGNDTWALGDLAPGAEHDITIKGKMIDVFEGEEKTFHASTGSQSDTDKSEIGVAFNSVAHTISIEKPFIQAALYVNGVYQSEYASDSNTKIQGEIRWANNLDTKVNDMKITAKISGNAVDRRSIDADQGFYDSTADSITWDKNFNRDFAEVQPGDSGSVTFSLSPLASGGQASPEIDIEVSVSGKEPLEGNASTEIDNSESKVIRIISNAGLATKALYYSGPFQNTGPIPPVAEKETTYTIVWTLSNDSNNISNAQVRSSLPPWVRFVGPVDPKTENVTYNSSTQEVVWAVGSIPAGTGGSSPNREASFQVALTPSLSQVSTAPALINDAILTGFDDFAKVNVTVHKAPLNTALINDPAFPVGGDRVIDSQ